MKKIAFLIVVFFLSIGFISPVKAQIVGNATLLEYKAGNFYCQGVKLNKDALFTVLGEYDYNNVYMPLRKNRTAGIILTAAGVPATIAGGYLLYNSISLCSVQSDNPAVISVYMIGGIGIGVGAAAAGLGLASIISGICLWSKGSNELQNIAHRQNERVSFLPGNVSLSLSTTSNGYGLIFSF